MIAGKGHLLGINTRSVNQPKWVVSRSQVTAARSQQLALVDVELLRIIHYRWYAWLYETQSALSNFPWRPMGYDGIKSLFFIPSYICTTLGGSTGCVWTCSMYQVQRYSVNNNTPGLVYAIIVRNFSLTLRLNALILLLCCRQTPAIIAKSCFLSLVRFNRWGISYF